jgi:hypothetical protein
MKPLHPHDTGKTSNGEEALASSDAAERAADQAEQANPGRGGSPERRKKAPTAQPDHAAAGSSPESMDRGARSHGDEGDVEGPHHG